MVKTIDIMEGQNAQAIAYLLEHQKATAKELACHIHSTKDPSSNQIIGIHTTLSRLDDYIDSEGSQPKKYSLSEHGKKLIEKTKSEKEQAQKKQKERMRLVEEKEGAETELIAKLREYLAKHHLKEMVQGNTIKIDISKVNTRHPEIAGILYEEPSRFMLAIREAILQDPNYKGEIIPAILISGMSENQKIELAEARKTQHLEKLISFDGLLTNIGRVHPLIVSVIWQCKDCGNPILTNTKNGYIVTPERCECGCRRYEQSESTIEDSQILGFQEPSMTDKPAEINVRLMGCLVEETTSRFIPGGTYSITGISTGVQPKKNSASLEPQIVALSLEQGCTSLGDIEISEDDEARIIEMSSDPTIYDNLIKSVCPAVHGWERVKESLLLQAFGGCEKTIAGSRKRGNIHVLLLGDPATSKTIMGTWMLNIVPKSRVISGDGSSEVGITVAAVKDENGQWMLKAGAIVLCSEGLLVLDEFEKISKHDASYLNSAMEQGSISVSKAGFHGTFPAKTSVLALCNPRGGGFFDDYKNIHDQLPEGMKGSTETRFDIVHILRDKPNPKNDNQIADKMLAENDDDVPVSYKSEELLKYISYSQRIIPSFTSKGRQALKAYWQELRKLSSDGSGFRVTARVLETLRRLSQAVARAHLSEVVELEHIQKANEHLKHVYEELGKDISGLMGGENYGK